MLKEGLIERIAASPWISPIVVTTKKRGRIRLCTDLREPNMAIVADSHPLPHIKELLSELRGASMFSTIDLASAYITAIRNAPAPHNLVALRSFLGLISWYSKFLANFATVVEPMRALLRKATDSGFQWTADADRSFHKLKQLLLDSPVLALFDPSLLTFVTTDVSDYGLGGVLTQLHPDGTELGIDQYGLFRADANTDFFSSALVDD